MAQEAESPHDGTPEARGNAPDDAGLPGGMGLPSLARLVEEHHAPLYRYAYRLTGSVHDAEDLTQQAFLVAREKLSQVRDERHVRGWLTAVLRNCYLKGFRQHWPTPVASIGMNLDSVPEASHDSPIDSEQLQLVLGRLPADFRVVLLMFYFEELSYRDIAEALAIPLGTVMSRLARAKNRLREILEPEAALEPAALAASVAAGRSAPTRGEAALGDPETPASLLPFSPRPVANRR